MGLKAPTTWTGTRSALGKILRDRGVEEFEYDGSVIEGRICRFAIVWERPGEYDHRIVTPAVDEERALDSAASGFGRDGWTPAALVDVQEETVRFLVTDISVMPVGHGDWMAS